MRRSPPAGESLLQKAADLQAMVAEDGSFRHGVDCLQFVHAFPSTFEDLIDIYNFRYASYREVRRRTRPPQEEYVKSREVTLMGPLMTSGDLHFQRFFDCKTEVPNDLFKTKVKRLIEGMFLPADGWWTDDDQGYDGRGFERFIEDELFEDGKLSAEYVDWLPSNAGRDSLDNFVRIFRNKKIYEVLCEAQGHGFTTDCIEPGGHRHDDL